MGNPSFGAGLHWWPLSNKRAVLFGTKPWQHFCTENWGETLLYSSYWRLLEDGKWEVDSPYPVRETHCSGADYIRGFEKDMLAASMLCVAKRLENPYSERCNLHLWTFPQNGSGPRIWLWYPNCKSPRHSFLTTFNHTFGQVTDSMKLVFLVFWFCLVALHGDVQSSRAVVQAVFASRKAILCFLSGLEGTPLGNLGCFVGIVTTVYWLGVEYRSWLLEHWEVG